MEIPSSEADSEFDHHRVSVTGEESRKGYGSGKGKR